ncbi:PREDICTED: uncharacterized protein C20orf195 homolog [Tauraco erythrolophus]|uniref:uncharacterized protein C20orf195 homolog n=1 Tax=Tauraco erythrolophus TaxID=121530 RepID=UPI00052397BB|nr:PREDICTED: uncharacterized protein C20orf195 homolog [Tauraco erythrolophus]
MAGNLNGSETSWESAAHSRGHNGRRKLYLKRRSHVVHFLRYNLSLQYLQYHQHKAELLSKSSFYLKIEPRYVPIDENHDAACIDILELVDHCRFQRVKNLGKKQAEIQLSLLTELLEHLERGREELSWYVETCDAETFLSRWDLIEQKVGKLCESMKALVSLRVPGNLYVKDQLVSNTALESAELPDIRLSLCTKFPLIFDRRESFAHKTWARLKWFDENQESHEEYDLHFKLLTDESQAQAGYGRIQQFTSKVCIVRDLEPGRSYEFTVRRSNTQMFVLEKWHDHIILKTKT